MKHAFDREKLEQLMQWHTAEPTDEFLIAELERCKDPRYFYNNYWIVDGKAPNPVSEEQWKDYFDKQNAIRNGGGLLKRRGRL